MIKQDPDWYRQYYSLSEAQSPYAIRSPLEADPAEMNPIGAAVTVDGLPRIDAQAKEVEDKLLHMQNEGLDIPPGSLQALQELRSQIALAQARGPNDPQTVDILANIQRLIPTLAKAEETARAEDAKELQEACGSLIGMLCSVAGAGAAVFGGTNISPGVLGTLTPQALGGQQEARGEGYILPA